MSFTCAIGRYVRPKRSGSYNSRTPFRFKTAIVDIPKIVPIGTINVVNEATNMLGNRQIRRYIQ
jgi:hypothetical protein